MASTNQSPFYKKAEENFLNAQTDEERLRFLDEMIKECPKHKSSEKMLANLKTRRIKLIEKIEKIKKSKSSGKSSKESIKKLDMQVVLIGFTNSGKSSLIKALTNTTPPISPNQFTTKYPIQGILDFQGVQIQIIDQASLKSEDFDIGIVNNTDLLLLVITKIDEIKEIQQYLQKFNGKKIIVYNKIDYLTQDQIRKISETLKSKRYDFVLTSANPFDQENYIGIDDLKEKIFTSFSILRIYLKEPGKEPSMNKPLIIKPPATVKDVASKISKQMIPTIKEVHIWGPSSKFPNQKVGLNHIVKDKDIVEFKTR